MAETDLSRRAGLPGPLRLLLHVHPRESWEAHPRFAGLVTFWLDRHAGFRRMLELLRRDARAFDQREIEPRRFAAGLSRVGGAFLQNLHGHHHIEDHHLFPPLAAAEARIAAGFDLLEADHVALSGHLDSFATEANALLRAIGEGGEGGAPPGPGAAWDERLARLERFLDRHLTDEEDLVVPLILDRGPEELGLDY